MSELATYSIETDHTVLLSFKDGRRMRVPIGQLSHHLAPPDLAKVREAIKLRRDFIRRHMPKVALLVAATGLVGVLSVGSQVVARLINPPETEPTPSETGIVRNQLLESPSPAPVRKPEVKGAATIAEAKPSPAPKPPKKRATPKRAATPSPTPKPNPAVPLQAPQPTPAPSSSPQPSAIADGDTTEPTPLPTPQVPNQGDVLGDSTGPDDPPPADSTEPLADAGPTLPTIP